MRRNLLTLLPKYRLTQTLNENVLYHHDECQGSTGNLYVKWCWFKGKLGWRYHCFSCETMVGGLKGFYPIDTISAPSETLLQLQSLLQAPAPDIIVRELVLPEDTTHNLPNIARRYMMKYGLTDEEIKLSRFGWSDTLERMIMPVYAGKELLYWQGRNLGEITDERPKYKNVYLQGSRDVFAKFNCLSTDLCRPFRSTVVLVEAIVSAVKLSRHADSIALLGSYIPNTILSRIKKYKRVVLWLDPDKRQTSIVESMRLNSLSGLCVVTPLTDKKPKEYNDDEIIQQLG